MDFLKSLEVWKEQLPEQAAFLADKIANFYQDYRKATQEVLSLPECVHLFEEFVRLVTLQLMKPHHFALYHQKVRSPIDYTRFGLQFTASLIDFPHSSCGPLDQLEQMQRWIDAKENVVLLANHQIELDPLVIMLMLQDRYPKLAEEMIFVAGQKVLTNPVAVPFSLGCNLLCIYSRRYIDHDPATKLEKQRHNQMTMKVMRDLLAEGGKCIYVAPSGGRDRPLPESGEIELAPFDPDSIEMLRLMAMQSKKPTHFCTLALFTMPLLPPPPKGEQEEPFTTARSPVHLAFGKELSMENTSLDKHQDRQQRAQLAYRQMAQDYAHFFSS